MTGTVALRPITDADADFLCALYASTREEELASVPWPAEQKEAFLRQQFAAQDRQYRRYAGADYSVVLEDGRAIGRLYLSRTPDEIRIVDIALVPSRRGAGIGTRLLQPVLDEGERTGTPVGIHVECFNPARRLYERLGFVPREDRGVYLYMVREPGSGAQREARGQVNTAS